MLSIDEIKSNIRISNMVPTFLLSLVAKEKLLLRLMISESGRLLVEDDGSLGSMRLSLLICFKIVRAVFCILFIFELAIYLSAVKAEF